MARSSGSEILLEVGLVVAFALVVSGLVTLLYGRAAGSRLRMRREREGSPVRGSVPSERHEHTGTAAAR